jgi:hypothetical protein
MKSFGAVITYNGKDCDGFNSMAGKIFTAKRLEKARREAISYNRSSDGIICNVRSWREVIESRKEAKKNANDYTPVNDEKKDFRLYERFEKTDHGFRYFSEFKASLGFKPFRD